MPWFSRWQVYLSMQCPAVKPFEAWILSSLSVKILLAFNSASSSKLPRPSNFICIFVCYRMLLQWSLATVNSLFNFETYCWQLYKNGLQRELFLPCIESIKRHCDVHAFHPESPDYRLIGARPDGTRFTFSLHLLCEGCPITFLVQYHLILQYCSPDILLYSALSVVWYKPLNMETANLFEKAFIQLAGGRIIEPTVLKSGSRSIEGTDPIWQCLYSSVLSIFHKIHLPNPAIDLL